MSLLSNLPTELIGCVIANIDSRPTLCNLARCSRQFYLCTVPHLYRHVTITEEERLGGGVGPKSLRMVTRLLIQKPFLANLVRGVTLEVAEPSKSFKDIRRRIRDIIVSRDHMKFETAKLASRVLKEDIFHLLDKSYQNSKTSSDAFNFSEGEEHNTLAHLSDMDNWSNDLVLALLLSSVLKVEMLSLDLQNCFCKEYLEFMMMRATRGERPFDIRSPFQSLIVFSHSLSRRGALSASFLASLLKLPAILEISGSFALTSFEYVATDGAAVARKNLRELDSASSPVNTLNIAYNTLGPADLLHILRAPTALQNFYYRVTYPFHISFIDIRRALGPQEKSLQSLILDSDRKSDKYIRERAANGLIDRSYAPMTSFNNFNALKFLKIAAVFLIKTDKGTGRGRLLDIFPRSLEIIHLNRMGGYSSSLFDAVEYLVAQMSPPQIPLLTRLILEGREDFVRVMLFNNTQEPEVEGLSWMAASRNISIEVVETN